MVIRRVKESKDGHMDLALTYIRIAHTKNLEIKKSFSVFEMQNISCYNFASLN